MGCTVMLFTKAEIEVLRLCAWCKDLPTGSAEIFPADITDCLLSLGLIRLSNSGLGFRVTATGYALLQKIGFDYPQDKQYLGKSPALIRRLHSAEITGFLWRMGVDVFCEAPPTEKNYNGFLPSFALRRKAASNILGGTRLCGFYYTGNNVFIPYYLESDNDGIYASVEQRTFCSEVLCSKRRPFVIYTGPKTLEELITVTLSQKEKSNKCTTDSYSKALLKFDVPAALVPQNTDGMRQLRIISKPDYRKRLIRAVLGKDFLPPVKEATDGWSNVTRESYLIGIDCNIKRFDTALCQSKNPHIIILSSQADALQQYLKGKNAILHPLDTAVVEKILGIEESDFEVPILPFITEKGEYLETSVIRQIKKS